MILESVRIDVVEAGPAPADQEGKAAKYRNLVVFKTKEKSKIPGSTRLVDGETKGKSDLLLEPGQHLVTLSVTPYSIGGTTGLSVIILAAKSAGATK